MPRCAALLLALLAASVLGASGRKSVASSDEERLPGWKGEIARAAVPQRRRWIEPLSWRPRAFLYHGFLSAEETAHVRALAEPRLERSQVFDTATGEGALCRCAAGWPSLTRKLRQV